MAPESASDRDADSGKSFLDDPASLRALVQQLPAKDLAEYDSYGALSLESVFPNRVMVAYTLRNGQPEDPWVLSFGDLTVSRDKGPECLVSLIQVSHRGSEGHKILHLSCVPQQLPMRAVFLAIPQNFILKWKGKKVRGGGVHFVPHYAVLIKSRSKEHHQIEGDTYCVRLNKFRERFPDTDIRY